MKQKLVVAAATALVGLFGFLGAVVDRATRGHPAARAFVYSVENEATKIIRSGFQCGVERWSVKTMSDPAATSINTLAPTATRIDKLVAIAAPSSGSSARYAPVETTAYKLTKTHLVAYKEELDSDIHLKLQAPSGATMIAEIPDPNCVSSPLDRTLIATARANFVKEIGTPLGYYQNVSATVTLEGVGFFDFVHGQNGVAPNGIELHPVLRFAKAGYHW